MPRGSVALTGILVGGLVGCHASIRGGVDRDAASDHQRVDAGVPPTAGRADAAALRDAALGGASGADAAPEPLPGIPDGSRRVWVHEMIELPWYDAPGPPYGANHPLELVRRNADGPRAHTGAALRKQAGFTGVQLLWGDGSADRSGQFAQRFPDYDAAGVELAPCMAPTTVDAAVDIVKKYVAVAEGHPSAARIRVAGELRWIVFVYGARYGRAPQFWKDVRAALDAQGVRVFLVGDVVTGISYNHGTFDPNRVEPFAMSSVRAYFGLFELAWTFDDGVDLQWPALVMAFADGHQPFAGGLMPAYNRESVASGGYSDAEATAKYRRQWELAIGSRLGWNNVVSWNDVSERHEVWPGSEWNHTRADVTAFHSAKLRGVAMPETLSSAQLYVTTPQRINLGQAARPAEALVLNGGAAEITVEAQLVDGSGAAWGAAVTKRVAAGAADAAVVSVAPTNLPAKRFLRLRAATLGPGGAHVQEVVSAPILVYDAAEQATGFAATRVKYLSVPARQALPGAVRLTLTGSPLQAGATATVEPAANVQVRFAEVLQNGFLVQNFFDGTPRTAPIPLVNGQQLRSNVVVDTPASGFYFARVIDEQERVGYSDPIYVPPP